MAARVAVTRQRTLDVHATPPKPSKRKPSARAAFRLDEIPVVAEAMTGTYALRDRLLFRCNTVWGLRAHEQLSMTIGDICHPDGAIKDSFVIASHRLKGGKPKDPTPPKRPDHYSEACHCAKCAVYDGRRQPKAHKPPAERHLLILPEMKTLLQAWLDAIKARVGTSYGLDTPLWLSRKRGTGGVWRAISRQWSKASVVYRTHRREAATRPHLNLKSVKKINFGDCQPIVLACSVTTNIWLPWHNSFSDKQLEIIACDRSFPPVGP